MSILDGMGVRPDFSITLSPLECKALIKLLDDLVEDVGRVDTKPCASDFPFFEALSISDIDDALRLILAKISDAASRVKP